MSLANSTLADVALRSCMLATPVLGSLAFALDKLPVAHVTLAFGSSNHSFGKLTDRRSSFSPFNFLNISFLFLALAHSASADGVFAKLVSEKLGRELGRTRGGIPGNLGQLPGRTLLSKTWKTKQGWAVQLGVSPWWPSLSHFEHH